MPHPLNEPASLQQELETLTFASEGSWRYFDTRTVYPYQ